MATAQKQKAFSILGIRIPAAETKRFPKRSTRLTLAIDPDLKSSFQTLADSCFMSTSTLALRVLAEWVSAQVIPGASGLRGIRKASA
jgi:predicted transcriptional regulator